MLVLITLVVFGLGQTAVAQTGAEKNNNLYLVVGSEGPGFTEAIQVLEKGILPTFDALLKLQREGKIIAGGLPVGDRALMMIVQASSNQEADKMLRSLPAWGALKWKVTALESIAGRAAQEREILGQLKKMIAK